jgi:hypothetical protein
MSPASAVAMLACLAALALAACGDDDEEGDGTTTATETTTTEAGAGASGEEGSGSTGPSDFQPRLCPGAELPPNITKVISYGATCDAVEDAMAQLGPVSKRFDLGDYSCERTSGSALAGTWTCKGEATYFIFEFAD